MFKYVVHCQEPLRLGTESKTPAKDVNTADAGRKTSTDSASVSQSSADLCLAVY